MRHFHEEMEVLKSHLVSMSGIAEELVRLAVEALLDRDINKAQAVVQRDDQLDALELTVDDLAINLLALQQPMARDLRFITAAMQIGNDLERVGDHAVNIAEELEFLLKASPVPMRGLRAICQAAPLSIKRTPIGSALASP